jgi:hypothetical protein
MKLNAFNVNNAKRVGAAPAEFCGGHGAEFSGQPA